MKLGAVAAAVVLLGLSLGLAGCGSQSSLHVARRDAQAEVAAGAGLRVVTANGGITVRAGSGSEAGIRAQIKAATPERLEATAIKAERDEDGTLVVSVAWPDGRRLANEGCTLEVVVPPASGVELRTTNGPVRVSGMGGAAEVSTTNGPIEVSDQGGAVHAETTNGRVRISDAGGDVRVRTTGGEVVVTGAAGAVDIESSNGAVEVALSPRSQGPVRVRTSNGRVDLRLGEAFRGELALKTSGGSVKFDGLRGVEVLAASATAARLRVGEGGEPSVVQTSNGVIRVSGGDRAAAE